MPSDEHENPNKVESATAEKSCQQHLQGILEACGIGIEMAKGVDPDEYIRELREGWE